MLHRRHFWHVYPSVSAARRLARQSIPPLHPMRHDSVDIHAFLAPSSLTAPTHFKYAERPSRPARADSALKPARWILAPRQLDTVDWLDAHNGPQKRCQRATGGLLGVGGAPTNALAAAQRTVRVAS